MSTTDTPQRLLRATIGVLAGPGIAGLSARSIASAAGVNQALIFYHFNSVTALVAEATRQSTREAVARHRPALHAATSVAQLFEVGRGMHAEEADRGSVRVMGQMLAAGQSDPEYAAAARDCLGLWFAEVSVAVERLLAGSPIRPLVQVDDLSIAIGAAFVGLELYEGVDAEGARRAMDGLATLGVLLDVLDGLGPVERTLVAARIKRASR